MGRKTDKDIEREEREYEREVVLACKLRALFEEKFSILQKEKEEEFNPEAIDPDGPYCEMWRDKCDEEMSWFQSIYNKETLFKKWLDDHVFPAAECGNKIGETYAELRKRKDEARHEEWKEYPDFLNEYFKRNPKHTLTNGRRACSNKYKASLRTIERRTKGYKKPPTG